MAGGFRKNMEGNALKIAIYWKYIPSTDPAPACCGLIWTPPALAGQIVAFFGHLPTLPGQIAELFGHPLTVAGGVWCRAV